MVSAKKEWLISILLACLILGTGGYFIYKRYSKSAEQVYGPGVNPKLVEYVKTMINEPETFQHIETVKINENRGFTTYIMKFSGRINGQKLTYDAYATCYTESGEVVECKIIHDM